MRRSGLAIRRRSSWIPRLDVPECAVLGLSGKARRRGMVVPCKEEQRSQAGPKPCNRVRSGLTHSVSANEARNVSIHAPSREAISGQPRNPGSWSRRDILRVLATASLFALTTRARADAIASEGREIGRFRAVELGGIGELLITQGERESLTIEAERRLLSRITANVRQGVLRFDYGQATIRTRAPIRFMLTVRDLEQLWLRGSGDCHISALRVRRLESENAGSGDLIIERLEAVELNASITGAGTVEVGGTVVGQRVNISGAGDYRAADLHSRWAEVVIAGSGNVELAVAERLAARIDGSGTIRYRGRPIIEQQIAGAGTIEPMGGESGDIFE